MSILQRNLFKAFKTHHQVINRMFSTPTVEEILQKHFIEPRRDWNLIKQEIIDSNRRVTPSSIDYIILATCDNANSLKIGLEYADHLKETKTELNMASIGRLLRICGTLNWQKYDTEVEKRIVELHEQLKKYDLLDVSIKENLIIALCSIKKIELGAKLLEEIKLIRIPTGLTYSALIIGCFMNNLEDQGWKYIEEMVNNGQLPKNECYITYINEYPKKLERMFQFWSDNDIIIQKNVADELKKALNAKNTFIDRTNRCKNCKLRLPKPEITPEEFKMLKETFIERVIVGKDTFRKTTPEELQTFLNFTKTQKHFDVIIDGLNVAYSKGTNNNKINSNVLLTVVKHFKRQNKTVLVVGRSHMNKWPNIKQLRQEATLFLAANLSQDDPYLLYCALNSGKGSIIVSRDLMRSHIHLLKDPKLKQVFKRWLSMSKYKFENVTSNGRVILKQPPEYLFSAQKLDNVWHIPFGGIEKSLQNNSINDGEDISWICVNKSE